jgi:RNA polymerase sigma-70 factor (ECF subfamily)
MVSKKRFEELLLPHRNAAFNLAYRILQSREEAEDAVQDAYLRAFRGFDAFSGDGARPWLLAIVRNVAYSALDARKRARNVITLDEDMRSGRDAGMQDAASTDPSPEAVAIAQGDAQLLEAALERLPSIHRDIVVLREMESLSYAEIAQVTGTAVGTVMSRLSRARAELRRILSGQSPKDGPDAL